MFSGWRRRQRIGYDLPYPKYYIITNAFEEIGQKEDKAESQCPIITG